MIVRVTAVQGFKQFGRFVLKVLHEHFLLRVVHCSTTRVPVQVSSGLVYREITEVERFPVVLFLYCLRQVLGAPADAGDYPRALERRRGLVQAVQLRVGLVHGVEVAGRVAGVDVEALAPQQVGAVGPGWLGRSKRGRWRARSVHDGYVDHAVRVGVAAVHLRVALALPRLRGGRHPLHIALAHVHLCHKYNLINVNILHNPENHNIHTQNIV